MWRSRIQTLTLLLAGIALSGCGGNRATYIPAGTDIVLEQSVTVTASVPDNAGTLQPHTVVTLPAGTIAKYDPKYVVGKPKGAP